MDNENITYNYDKTPNSSPYEETSVKTIKSDSTLSIDTLNDKSISILGFTLHFDDIIILVLILFLLQEEKKDYLLIGILALMFFDFSIDNLTNFEPIKKLLSNFT